VKVWGESVCGGFGSLAFPGCVIACDGLALKPAVEVTDEKLIILDLTQFEFNSDFLEWLTSSGEAFQEFVGEHSDGVFQTAFVYQLQSLDPHLEMSIFFAERATDGQARAQELGQQSEKRDIYSKAAYDSRGVCNSRRFWL
jgi:hypothetical protein